MAVDFVLKGEMICFRMNQPGDTLESVEYQPWTTELYEELHGIAERCFHGQPGDHTLQPTILVNEAWLKLARTGGWNDRDHFFSVAARAMRQILIDHARGRGAGRRGGGWTRVTLSGQADRVAESRVDLLSLDEALCSLAEADPRQAHMLELRFFAGLGAVEIARLTGLSRRTVELDLQMARAWVARAMADETRPHD